VAFSVAVSLSISAMEAAFLAALALRAARAACGEWPLPPRLYVAGGLGLLAAWIAASAAAPVPGESLPRVLRLYQLLVPLVLLEHTSRPEGARRLFAAYAVGVVAAALFGLAAWGLRIATTPEIRLEASFSTAMTSGNVFALATSGLWTYAWITGPGTARLATAATALGATALAATLTRSAWLGALAGSAAGTFFSRRRALGLVLLLAAALAAQLLPGASRRAAELADRTEYTARGRISLWRSGAEVFRERPLLGWGLADHSRLIAAHRRPDATFVAGHYHSNLVQIAVATGVVGLAAYGFFHAAAAWLLWRRRASPFAAAALAAWLAFHISGCFDWSFGDAEVAYQYFWWLGLGLAAATSR
jgi:O-antigen ligase